MTKRTTSSHEKGRGLSPTAAERIVATCRSYASSLRVVVVRSAMSAGTLIAMGADAILMTETAELGPIDPQMIVASGPEQGLRPAAAFVDAYQDLIRRAQEAIAAGAPPQPFLALLQKMDPTWIQVCLKARELARTIAREFLSQYMLRGSTDEDIDAVVDRFVKEGELLSHGRIIRSEKAREYGLKVDVAEHGSRLDKLLWELQARCEHYVQNKGLAEYLLCRTGGMNVGVQRLQA